MNQASTATSPIPQYDAVVIGAGVAGLYQLHRLRESGLKTVLYEAGSDVGGTWYWNRYPGARLDSQSYIYQYWFSQDLLKEWNWSERFAAQPENEAYLRFVADRCDLRKDMRFNAPVDAAHYDESTHRWTVTTGSGEKVSTQFLVSCTGMLSAPLASVFPGQERFKGQVFHTARWPKAPVEFAGKRVGVVGTGATGIQVIQTIADQVGRLTVFQRTPQYTIPMNNYKFTDAQRAELRARYPELSKRVHGTFAGFDYDFDNGNYRELPPQKRREILERLWAEGSLSFWVGSFPEIFFDPEVNAEISDFVRARIRARVNDPKVAELLVPKDYGFGMYRVPLERGYYEAYNRPNVELVDARTTPIVEMTETGVKTSDGRVYELDILILATGFEAGTGALTRIDIRGRGGRSLREDWGRDIRTTMGLQVHGYPNLFTTGAPLAPAAAFCNMPTCLQQQVDWITACIQHVRARGAAQIEPLEETQDRWVQHHDELANASLVAKGDSWYMGANVKGKPRRLLSYIGGVGTYRQKCDEVARGGYAGFAIA